VVLELLHARCAAVDIGNKDLKACVRTPNPDRRRSRRHETRTFATTTNALLELRDWLVAQQVTLVVMEATGDYRRDTSYLLEDCLNVMLVNAAHAKGLPGRKTDVADPAWLCQLGEYGLLTASFVPPEPIQHLRDLTRYRTILATERTREANRLEKELEDAGITLSTVASDILGRSGREMPAALIAGERDVHTLAEMATGRMRPKIPHLIEALRGNFGDHHAFMCRMHPDHIDQLTTAIEELSTRIEDQTRPFAHQIQRLHTIPGIGQTTTEVIIAETGGDMTRFATAGHLASWAGVCPGQHESAGKKQKRQNPTRQPMAARNVRHRRDVDHPHQRHPPRRPLPATGTPTRQTESHRRPATHHLTAVWHMLTHDTDHHDLGGDYFTQRDPQATMRRITRQANALGLTVRFDPTEPNQAA
jgi:transposase